MRIGILGAPNSGKSQLAEELAEKLKPKSTYIVDGYIEEASKESGIAIYPLTPYVGNLLVALKRFAKEHRHRDYADNIITAGTILETQLYEAVEGMNSDRFKPYEDEHQLRIESCLHTLGCLYLDSFVYDILLFTKYEGEVPDWLAFSEQIEAILKQYEHEYVLLEGDMEARIKTAMKEIKKVAKKSASKNPTGSGVPGSGKQSPENGSPAESVSNVQEQAQNS